MADRGKGLQRLGAGWAKVGRIFVPPRADQQAERERRRTIVGARREWKKPVPSFGAQDRPKRKNPKVTKKRRRKIAHESRRRNHWQGKRKFSRR